MPVSFLEQRANLLLPLLCNLVLTAVYLPRSFRKALTYYRAAQVYVRQPLDGDKSQDPATVELPPLRPRWQRIGVKILEISPYAVQLLLVFTSGRTYENSWWIIVSTRRAVPYALICAFLYMALWLFFTLRVNSMERLTRTHDGFERSWPSMWSTDECEPSMTAEEYKSTCLRIKIASLVLSAVGTLACIYLLPAVGVIGLFSASCLYICAQIMHIWPNLFFKCSVRLHILVFFAISGILVIYALVGVALVLLLIGLFEWTGLGDKLEGLPDPGLDHVLRQYEMCANIFIFFILYLLPASLLMLAYRMDASKAGNTDVDDADAAQCMEQSRQVAAKMQQQRGALHPFDQAGRTAVLTEAIKPYDEDFEKPLYHTALKLVYGIHAIFALLYLFAPRHWVFNDFPHTNADVDTKLTMMLFNLPAVICWLVLMPVMLVSAGRQARNSGQAFSAGVREVWSYEEDWFTAIPALPKRQLGGGGEDQVQPGNDNDIENDPEAMPLHTINDTTHLMTTKE